MVASSCSSPTAPAPRCATAARPGAPPSATPAPARARPAPLPRPVRARHRPRQLHMARSLGMWPAPARAGPTHPRRSSYVSVACGMLGYAGGFDVPREAYGLAPPDAPVTVFVECTGHEGSLDECLHKDPGGCYPEDAAGVVCMPANATREAGHLPPAVHPPSRVLCRLASRPPGGRTLRTLPCTAGYPVCAAAHCSAPCPLPSPPPAYPCVAPPCAVKVGAVRLENATRSPLAPAAAWACRSTASGARCGGWSRVQGGSTEQQHGMYSAH